MSLFEEFENAQLKVVPGDPIEPDQMVGTVSLYDEAGNPIAVGGAVSSSPGDFTVGGKLVVPTPGQLAGILLGGDANLYRAAADQLRTDDSLYIAGCLGITPVLMPKPAWAKLAIAGNLGDTAESTTVYGALINPIYQPVNDDKAAIGLFANPQIDSSLAIADLTAVPTALRGRVGYIAGARTLAEARGVYGNVYSNTGAGPISNAYGSRLGLGPFASAVTNAYGARIDAPTLSAGGSFANVYGLYIADHSAVVVSGSLYSVFVAGGDSRFDGVVIDNNNHQIRTNPTLSSGLQTLARTMRGLELLTGPMAPANTKYTPAIKFMSADAELVTENPKLGAFIIGRATETYNADTSGGMAIDIATTLNAPGANNVPLVKAAFLPGGLALRDDAGTLNTATARLLLSSAGTTQADGILWGSDTNLYRSAPDTLKTDDALFVGGNFACRGSALAAKPTVTGAKGSNAALASLLTALAAQGLITDSTTA